MPIVWTAGHNMPGYLPEGDVVAFETRPEAMQYTVGELREAAEHAAELDSVVCTDESCDHKLSEMCWSGKPDSPQGQAWAAEYEEAADALEGRDAEGGDWYDTFEDGRIAYWFMSIDMTDEEAREALEGEQ